MNNATVIVARDFVDEKLSVVESAGLVARRVVEALQSGESVVVSVRGLRGVSSSFFNVLLDAAEKALGSKLDNGQFTVETETTTQRTIYDRSYAAFLNRKR
jgi:hypothetical protein